MARLRSEAISGQVGENSKTSSAQSFESRFEAKQEAAHSLASRFPELLADASRVAHTVAQGMHGRRRRGPGDTFWQYRQYEISDTASMIDWRKSAGSDHHYIREKEWEAAHTVWLGIDLSASMQFVSKLAPQSKQYRMIVLALALSELLVRGGERVGVPSLLPPSASRYMPQRLAESLFRYFSKDSESGDFSSSYQASNFQDRFQISSATRFSSLSEVVLLSDFMTPVDEVAALVEQLASQNVRGHLIQILDPAEENLPYKGRVIFEDVSGGQDVVSENVQQIAETYQVRMQAHRRALQDICKHIGWSFQIHHTDRPAEEAMMALYTQIGGAGL